MAADNKVLGQFDLVGIPPSSRGMPQIEVTFDIDANGLVNVSAKDKATGKEQQIRIKASGGLSDEEIDGMVQDAEANADADKERRELVEVRNGADALIHSSEKNIVEYGDKVPEEDKTAIEAAIAELKTALEGEDAADIKTKTEALTEVSMKLGEAIYKASQEEEAAKAAAEGSTDDADSSAASDDPTVVDADFEEVDPKADKDK